MIAAPPLAMSGGGVVNNRKAGAPASRTAETGAHNYRNEDTK